MLFYTIKKKEKEKKKMINEKWQHAVTLTNQHKLSNFIF